MRTPFRFLTLGCLLFLTSGCGSQLKTYVKQQAPWSVIQRVAVLPFATPTEDPVRRELVTQLFTEELRRAGITEVVEVPLSSPVGGAPQITQVARDYQVDAVFTGAVDETHGTVVHVRLQDGATEEMLWSGTYILGMRAEFFTLTTQQQKFQRAFEKLVDEFAEAAQVS